MAGMVMNPVEWETRCANSTVGTVSLDRTLDMPVQTLLAGNELSGSWTDCTWLDIVQVLRRTGI